MLSPRFIQNFSREVEKTANEKKDERRLGGKDVARGLGATSLASTIPWLVSEGTERVTGATRFAHGTSSNAAESIRRSGLQPSFGGAAHGASASINNPAYVKSSKGNVHIAVGPSRRSTAGAHATLAQAAQEARKRGETLDTGNAGLALVKGLFPFSRKGETIEGVLPHRTLAKHFSIDPDLPGGALRGAHTVDPKHFSAGKASLLDLVRGRDKDMKGYIREHPGRFAAGAGMLAAAPLAGYGAYRLARPTLRKFRSAREGEAGASPVAHPTKSASLARDVLDSVRENPVAAAAGTGALLSGGASLYDMYRGRKHQRHYNTIRRAMYNDEGHVDSKEYISKLDPTVKVVSTIEDAHAFAQDELLERPELKTLTEGMTDLQVKDVKREIAKQFIGDYVIPGGNAGAVRGLKGDYIIASKRAPAALLEHELGHIKDFREKGVRMLPEDEAKNPYTGASLRQFLWKPSFMKREHKAEVEAWDRSDKGVKDYDKLREAGRGTYETAFHKRRGTATGLLAAGLAMLAAKSLEQQ